MTPKSTVKALGKRNDRFFSGTGAVLPVGADVVAMTHPFGRPP